MALDPVCGMTVDPAKARFETKHAGKRYVFCAASCKAKFEKDPARYLAPKTTAPDPLDLLTAPRSSTSRVSAAPPIERADEKAPAKPAVKLPEKPAAKPLEKPAAKTPDKLVARPPEKLPAKAPEKPSAKTPEKPVAKAIEKPVAKLVAAKPATKPVDPPPVKSARKTVSKPPKEPIAKPAARPVAKRVDPPAVKAPAQEPPTPVAKPAANAGASLFDEPPIDAPTVGAPSFESQPSEARPIAATAAEPADARDEEADAPVAPMHAPPPAERPLGRRFATLDSGSDAMTNLAGRAPKSVAPARVPLRAPAPAAPPTTATAGAPKWICPMDPEVVSDRPGACPKCGMALEPASEAAVADDEPDAELVDLTRRFGVGALLAAPVFAYSMLMMLPGARAALEARIPMQVANWVQLALATPVVFWSGAPFFKRALVSARARSTNMFTLIVLGVTAAWIYSAVATVAPGVFPHAVAATAA